MNLRKALLIHDNEYNGKLCQECPRLRRDGPKRKRQRDVIDEQQKARLEESRSPVLGMITILQTPIKIN